MFDAIMNFKKDVTANLLTKLNIKLAGEEKVYLLFYHFCNNIESKMWHK